MTSDDPEEPEATTGSSEDSSGERSDPRESDASVVASGSSDASAVEDDIPLDIVGHDRRRESKTDLDDPFGGEPAGGRESAESDADTDDESADEDEAKPVELLVQLAKDGEIDPWDIDIVRVTDKFLAALDERDLRTSGRALFYASVLLRMKSDELFAITEPEDEEPAPWEAAFLDDGPIEDGDGARPGFDPIQGLEAEMERRLERKHARGQPETLDELVRELREAERGSWWKKSRSYDTSGSPRGWDRGVQELSYHAGDDFRVGDEPTADDVTHTAHNEEIDTVIDAVEDALTPHFEEGREEVLFAEIDEAGGSRMMSYLALLFLAHRGRVRLHQDEFFGDLWISEVTVAAEPTEAVAD